MNTSDCPRGLSGPILKFVTNTLRPFCCVTAFLTVLHSATGLVGQVWPVPDWQVAGSPEELGFTSSGLQDYSSWLQSNVSGGPYGTVVVRSGKIAFEKYGGGGSESSKWEIGSIRKPVACSLVGIAISEGKLTLDDPVYDVWPDIFTLTGKQKDKEITERQLITSTSMWKTSAQPGEFWQYRNIAFTAGHAVVGRVYNLPDDEVAPMVETRIRDVIGANDWTVYHFDNSWNSSTGPKLAVDSTMRDLSRYGYLWLRQGEWNGQQIVPASFVLEAQQNHVSSYGRHYGYYWFINDGKVLLPDAPADAYYHIGNGTGGRRTVLLVCPSLDLVAVISTHQNAYDFGSDYLQQPVPSVNQWIKQVVEAAGPIEGGGDIENVAAVAGNATVSTREEDPVDVTLNFSDPDGPGPYSYTVDDPNNGVLSGTAPDLTYTPDDGFLGTDFFTWSVNDGEDESNVATVTIDVINSTILFEDDFARVDSSVLSNGWEQLEASSAAASILDGALHFESMDRPSRPLVSRTFPAQSSGSITWTFDLDFRRSGSEGTYAFWMQLGESSGMDDSDPTAAGVAVNLLWGSPNQGLSTHQGLGYVLDGNVDHVATVSGLHTVSVRADLDTQTYDVAVGDEMVTDIPFDDASSIDSVRFFTDRLNTRNFGSREVDNVSVVVASSTEVNFVPVAEDLSLSAISGEPLDLTLTLSDADGPGPYVYNLGTPTNGALSGTAPDLTYTADSDFTGLDSFTWTVNDGIDSSNVATVIVDVESDDVAPVVNVAPVANDATVSTSENTPVDVTLTATDEDGPGPYVYSVGAPSNGTLSGTEPDLTYTPDPGYSGQDSFTWTVSDGLDASDAAMVTIDVADVNSVPMVQDQDVTTFLDTAVGVTLSYSDPDGPDDPPTFVIGDPTDGAVAGTPPNLTYTPNPGFTGLDSFQWLIDDGLAESSVATVTITVRDTAVGFEDDFSRPDSSTVGNDWVEMESEGASTSVDDGSMVFESTDNSIRPLISQTFPLQGSGVLTWTFDLNFRRRSEGTYAFWMQLGEQASMNDNNPSASGVAVNLKWGSPNRGLANHEGLGYVVDGEVTHVATSSGLETINVCADLDTQTYDLAIGGELVVGIPFDDDAAIDTVRFFTDGLRTTNFFTHEIDNLAIVTSSALNFAPVADDQSETIITETPVDLTMSFLDPDGPGPYSFNFGSPAAGIVSGSGPDVTYTPNAGFVGTDSFTWSVSDGLDESLPATFTIDIVPDDPVPDDPVPDDPVPDDPVPDDPVPDDPVPDNTVPVTTDQLLSTDEDMSLDLTLIFNDLDGPGPFTFIIDTPLNGTLTGTAPDDLSYTPDAGFVGNDSFTWLVNDGLDDSETATVRIDVRDVNEIPVAQSRTVSTSVDLAVDITLTYVDSDGPGPFIYTTGTPMNGILSGQPPDLTYTPDADFTGEDSFDWSVNDGSDDSNAATVTINVSGAAGVIFEDSFDRAAATAIDNGWIEEEDSSKSLLQNGGVVFDAIDTVARPLVSHSFALQTSGVLSWAFDFNFDRTGPEGTYAFWMQLGDGAQMSLDDPTSSGVAVNLIWGGPRTGLDSHEGIGHVADGEITQIATASGMVTINVTVDLDAQTYHVTVGDVVTTDIPFDNGVSIDTVRFFADRLNRRNFASRSIDTVRIAR